MWRVDEIIKAVKGTPYRIERDTFAAISTDSRTIGEGDLFIPLSGPNFDGHLFIGQAFALSRGGTICEKKRAELCNAAGGTTILVDDSLKALIDLARWKRSRLSGICIALTGSNGKTTTKEILVAMVRRAFSVSYNEKNYNNLIGVPKSILAITGEPEVLVFELGTNAPGEIKILTETTMPDLSLITNINASHLEGLFNLEGVLNEKLDLLRSAREGGIAFLNGDDPYLDASCKDRAHKVYRYGIVNDAPFRLSVAKELGWEGYEIDLDFEGERISTRTRLLGTHNLYNILAASSLAWKAGIDRKDIVETIETFGAFSMRFTPIESSRGFKIINDTYNANPSSMEWAIRTVEALPCDGSRIAIMGDMKELGEKTAYYHGELGRFLKGSSISTMLLVGEHTREVHESIGEGRSHWFENKEKLIEHASQILRKGDVILVKGSRAAKMEEIVEALG